MESEVKYEFETAEQFWHELERTISQSCESDELIDDALRSYIALTTGCPEYVETDNDLRQCAYKLYSSTLFQQHAHYVRNQLVYSFLQDDESQFLYIISTLLLADARENDSTFELLNNEGAFQRMVGLIKAPRSNGEEGLHRLLMELMYEMARIQKISNDDLVAVDDDFMCLLFGIIEQVSGDVTDPYHYPVIRVLLVLNEQYMVAAHDPKTDQSKAVPLTNRVIKVLSSYGSRYKTFGENIILLLNREDETSLQLLTLKLLYLLFTTPSTYEYFYTNDLHVLVDILIRNLLDLPEEAIALRHTYLRVLYPLLEYTQLNLPPHYKRNEIHKLLTIMAGEDVEDIDESVCRYFADVDDTTKRLVKRCQTVSWLTGQSVEIPQVESPIDVELSVDSLPESPTRISKTPPALPAPRKLKKRSSSRSSDLATGPYLNPQLEARQSSLSMMEMAAQKEKPGVKTPSRNASAKHGLRGLVMQKKEKPPPPPPKARRSGPKKDRHASSNEAEIANATVDSTAENSVDDNAQDSTNEDLHIKTTQPLESKDAEHISKKPPPVPKNRRWRGKRAKQEEQSAIQPREPGKFTTDLPSITTTNTDAIPETSPFSPPAEKTLSPEMPLQSSPYPPRVSSVSAALNQARIQAIQNIEETLEKAHLDTHVEHGPSIERDSPPLKRPVLAPPGQPPIRGVPGPTMELERSPFLSDDDSDDRVRGTYFTEDIIPEVDEKRESQPDLKVETQDSEDEWNDF